MRTKHLQSCNQQNRNQAKTRDHKPDTHPRPTSRWIPAGSTRSIPPRHSGHRTRRPGMPISGRHQRARSVSHSRQTVLPMRTDGPPCILMPRKRASSHWSTLPRMGRARQENHSRLDLSNDHLTRVRSAMGRLPAPLQHQGQRRHDRGPTAAGLRRRAVGAATHPHPTANHITTLQAPKVCPELGGSRTLSQFLFINEPTTIRPRAQFRTLTRKTQYSAHIKPRS